MKHVLITGIASGLGTTLAELFLEQGYAVHGTYHSHADEAQAMAKQYPNLTTYRFDAADSAAIDPFVAELGDIKFDVLVNNAAVFTELTFDNLDRMAFEREFRINTFTPFYLAQALRYSFVSGASIVNIASNDAMIGAISGAAYSASKAALISLTQSLANIMAPRNIRANAVAPGWFGDGMDAPQDLLDMAAEQNLLKRVADYREIAEVVLFLASAKSSYVNGTTITADGGDMATSYLLQQEARLLDKS